MVRVPEPRPPPLSRPLAVWEPPCPPADPPVRTWPWGKFSCALRVPTPPPERTKSETTPFGKVIPERFPHGAGRSSRREVPCARPPALYCWPCEYLEDFLFDSHKRHLLPPVLCPPSQVLSSEWLSQGLDSILHPW